ncbi:response regulator [Paenibacillus sp. FSL R7-0345]|uniref:response regulator n=1 Tax=Paenibacillus sp. FSL R7-0345 TaxID=2954535 RepID=UPI00315A9E0E
MLKAVVFDDESIVLKGLERLINWEEYGVKLAGTAMDGISALALFRQLQPEIVMTDIRMPGMDGLKLIELIRQEAPETMCIVFTGFNEYSYVKQALKMGVIDYLEKPVTITTIREGIRKAVRRIHELSELSELKQKWKSGVLEKATLNLLLSGPKADRQMLEEWTQQFGEAATRVQGVTVITATEEINVPQPHDCRVIYVRNGPENIYMVVHMEPPPGGWLDAPGNQPQGACGSGRTYEDPGSAALSYNEAKKALKYGLYLEERGWTSYEEISDGGAEVHSFTDQEEEVFLAMRRADPEIVAEKLDQLLEELRLEKPNPEDAETQVLLLYFHGLEICRETGGNMEEIKPRVKLAQLELRKQASLEELLQWTRTELLALMSWIVKVRHQTKHAAVEKALGYIQSHYGRDLTQQEVADHIQMNTTYFSLLFKEEMGISYIKYLTRVRMEKAKLLLQEGKTINDTSEQVGYYHARHFSEIFKRYTGMTPGQYRLSGKRV